MCSGNTVTTVCGHPIDGPIELCNECFHVTLAMLANLNVTSNDELELAFAISASATDQPPGDNVNGTGVQDEQLARSLIHCIELKPALDADKIRPAGLLHGKILHLIQGVLSYADSLGIFSKPDLTGRNLRFAWPADLAGYYDKAEGIMLVTGQRTQDTLSNLVDTWLKDMNLPVHLPPNTLWAYIRRQLDQALHQKRTSENRIDIPGSSQRPNKQLPQSSAQIAADDLAPLTDNQPVSRGPGTGGNAWALSLPKFFSAPTTTTSSNLGPTGWGTNSPGNLETSHHSRYYPAAFEAARSSSGLDREPIICMASASTRSSARQGSYSAAPPPIVGAATLGPGRETGRQTIESLSRRGNAHAGSAQPQQSAYAGPSFSSHQSWLAGLPGMPGADRTEREDDGPSTAAGGVRSPAIRFHDVAANNLRSRRAAGDGEKDQLLAAWYRVSEAYARDPSSPEICNAFDRIKRQVDNLGKK